MLKQTASRGLKLATAPTKPWSRLEENRNHPMLEVNINNNGTPSLKHRLKSTLPTADKYLLGKAVSMKNPGALYCFQSLDDFGHDIRMEAVVRTWNSSRSLHGSPSRVVRVHSPAFTVQSQRGPEDVKSLVWSAFCQTRDGSHIQTLREVGREGRKTPQALHVRTRMSNDQTYGCKPSEDSTKSGTMALTDITTTDHEVRTSLKHRYGSTTPKADKYNRTEVVRIQNLFLAFFPQSPPVYCLFLNGSGRVKGGGTNGKCLTLWKGIRLDYWVTFQGVAKLLTGGGRSKSRYTQRKLVQPSTPIAGLPISKG